MKEKIKILIVDDSTLIIEGLIARLSEVDHFEIIAYAENGKDAFEKLKENQPDIIIMDVEMPVMNGFEATKKVLDVYPDIKVIALSTYDEKSVILKMLEAGASGYILKNIKKEELITAIETVLNGQNYYSSDIPLTMAKHSADDIILDSTSLIESPSSNPLSSREMEILHLIIQGLTNNQIGNKLFISPKTVNTHRTTIMKKLDVHNVAELIRIAFQKKIVK
jgi:DNA-binding NarL/FixJ family response regulator